MLGRTRRIKYRDSETGELKGADVAIDAYGIMPNPELLISKGDAKKVLGEEKEVKGFVRLEE